MTSRQHELAVTQLRDLGVRDLRIDSRQLRGGDAFFALQGVGRLHGATFADAALDAGAACVVIDRSDVGMLSPAARGRCVVVDDLRTGLGEFASAFYGRPSHKIPVVGVTGTDGKSSTAYFLAQLMSQAQPAYFIGTTGIGPWSALAPADTTTPSVLDVHRILAEAVTAGAPAVAMEVSSHAIDQGRVDGVRFSARALTNLERDHIDYHQTLERYHACKRDWLRAGEAGTPYAMAAVCPPGAVAVTVDALQASPDGLRWRARWSAESRHWQALVLGDFSASNISLAAALAEHLGVQVEQEAIDRLRPVDGRMQVVDMPGGVRAVVDYAHTPNALGKALAALAAHGFTQRIAVMGCGGDRDRGKRPRMAAAAEAGADFVVLTDDNPRSEAPEAIADDIVAGFSAAANYIVIHDRAEATRYAVERCPPGGVVLVAGKGHEDYQIVGAERRHYADIETLQSLAEQG